MSGFRFVEMSAFACYMADVVEFNVVSEEFARQFARQHWTSLTLKERAYYILQSNLRAGGPAEVNEALCLRNKFLVERFTSAMEDNEVLSREINSSEQEKEAMAERVKVLEKKLCQDCVIATGMDSPHNFCRRNSGG